MDGKPGDGKEARPIGALPPARVQTIRTGAIGRLQGLHELEIHDLKPRADREIAGSGRIESDAPGLIALPVEA